MALKRLSPKSQVNAAIHKKIAQAKQSIYQVFFRVGEECVNYARIHGSYMDQTGNLRSSIGYCVLDNGRVISQGGFEQVKGGAEGARTGKSFLREIRAKYNTGIVLIVVAGMNYAAEVESRGRDVISGSELLAEELAPKLLKKLGFDLAA